MNWCYSAMVLFIRCLDVINWLGNKKSIWLVSLPIRFLPFGKVQLSNKELQSFQHCWPSHCWITLDNSGFDRSEEVSKEEANKKWRESPRVCFPSTRLLNGNSWLFLVLKKHVYIKKRLLMDPVPSGFTFKWFFKPTFYVQSYETIDFTVFPLSIVLVIVGSPLIPNGERWESLWQMQIWKHREWWATWILGWSRWKPNKP